MLISEFIERTGYTPSEKFYHNVIEEAYYNFPGNKDEFCLQFIGRELHRVNDEYMECRKYLEQALVANDDEQIEVWTENTKMWDEIWHNLMEHRQALIKRMYN